MKLGKDQLWQKMGFGLLGALSIVTVKFVEYGFPFMNLLAMINDCIVFHVFFSNSLGNLHNFSHDWKKLTVM